MAASVHLLHLGSEWSTQHAKDLVANACAAVQSGAAPTGLTYGLQTIAGGNQVCSVTCPSEAAATELSAALEAYGQLPYILTPGEPKADAKRTFYNSSSCPATSVIDCAQFLEGRRCKYACSINEGKGLRLNEECCPFRHPVGPCTDACSMWQTKGTCTAGSRCSKRHPHALLLLLLQQRFPQCPPALERVATAIAAPLRGGAGEPAVIAAPAPTFSQPRPPVEPGNPGRLEAGAGARPAPRARRAAANGQPAPPVPLPPQLAAVAAPPPPPPPAAAAAARPVPPAAARRVARAEPGGAVFCGFAACLNSACTARHRNEQQRQDTIAEMLAPLQLLGRPAIPSEVQELCSMLHGRLHALTAASKPPGALRAQLLAVVDAFDLARGNPALPDNAYDSVRQQSRKLAEGIVQTLLHNQGVIGAEGIALAAGIAQLSYKDQTFKAALHVLRGYGNDASHYGTIAEKMPMVKQRYDVLLMVGSMAAYAYGTMLQQLR